MVMHAYNPTLGNLGIWKQEDPCGLLASQPSLLGELQTTERLSQTHTRPNCTKVDHLLDHPLSPLKGGIPPFIRHSVYPYSVSSRAQLLSGVRIV